jgi:hypothetical protein
MQQASKNTLNNILQQLFLCEKEKDTVKKRKNKTYIL